MHRVVSLGELTTQIDTSSSAPVRTVFHDWFDAGKRIYNDPLTWDILTEGILDCYQGDPDATVAPARHNRTSSSDKQGFWDILWDFNCELFAGDPDFYINHSSQPKRLSLSSQPSRWSTFSDTFASFCEELRMGDPQELYS